MRKRAEMMTLETVVDAVLVVLAFIFLLALAVGIYKLFFYDSSEQAAKESFHSLLATLDIMADNKPIERPFKLDDDYAIMDTDPEWCEFVEKVEGDNQKAEGRKIFNEKLSKECKTNDCLCLCESSAIGLCNEIIECKPVARKAAKTNYNFFSKMDPWFLYSLGIPSDETSKLDSKKTYDCVYIKGSNSLYSLKIVKLENELTFCSNSCNINDVDCCSSPSYMSIIDKNFAELQNTYNLCREETIAKTNPTDYFKLLNQGAYYVQRIDFLPMIAQQKAIYRYYFDAQGDLDNTKLGEKIALDTPFAQVTENLISSCKELTDLGKNGNLRKEFIGADNTKRTIELGKCPDSYQYYLRIIRLGQEKKLLFIDNNVLKTHFDLLSKNVIDIELFDDELYIIPKSEISEKTSDEYVEVSSEKSIKTAEIKRENKKLDINDKSMQEITLKFGFLLSINNHDIDIYNKLQRNTAQDIIETCDQLVDTDKLGEYYFIQDAGQDTSIGNSFKTIIDSGKCYKSGLTPEQIEEERRRIASNACSPGEIDCVGSTDTELNQELAAIAHLYLRIIKEDENGNKELLFKDETDTPDTILDTSKDYSLYAYYFYNNELYILDPASAQFELFNLYSIDLIDMQSSAISTKLDLAMIDTTKIKKPVNCQSQLIYHFFQDTELIISADGKLTLKANNIDIKTGSFNNLPIDYNNFVCMIKEGKPIDFSEKSITFTANQKLTFVDIGIDRLCLKVE